MKTFVFYCILLSSIFSGCASDSEGGIVFIGDSLIEYWDLEKSFPTFCCENRGVAGATIEDLYDVCSNYSDHVIVLLVGTNNLSLWKDDTFIDYFNSSYLKLVDKLQARKILVISLLPRDKFNNENIHKLNHSLKESLYEYPNVTFVDVFDSFLYAGNLNPEYSVDGLHLNQYGYLLLTQLLDKEL